MTNPSISPRPATLIKADITKAEIDLFNLPSHLPHLPTLEKVVADLAPRAQVDPTTYNPKLHEALASLDEARALHASKSTIELTIAQLRDELAECSRIEQMHQREEASRRLQQATSEYRHAALQAARLYRAMLTAANRAGVTPIDAELHIPHLMPVSWQGKLGDAMRQGTLPWEETSERKAA